MAHYEKEIKKREGLSPRWNKCLLLSICGVIFAFDLIVYVSVNLIWASRMKKTQSLLNKGEIEKGVYNLDFPLSFFNDKDTCESPKQIAKNIYLLIIYGRINDFLSLNKIDEVNYLFADSHNPFISYNAWINEGNEAIIGGL